MWRIPVDSFSTHVGNLHADGDIGFSKEYELIQNDAAKKDLNTEIGTLPDNKSKNRYMNIVACKLYKVHCKNCYYYYLCFSKDSNLGRTMYDLIVQLSKKLFFTQTDVC